MSRDISDTFPRPVLYLLGLAALLATPHVIFRLIDAHEARVCAWPNDTDLGD